MKKILIITIFLTLVLSSTIAGANVFVNQDYKNNKKLENSNFNEPRVTGSFELTGSGYFFKTRNSNLKQEFGFIGLRINNFFKGFTARFLDFQDSIFKNNKDTTLMQSKTITHGYEYFKIEGNGDFGEVKIDRRSDKHSEMREFELTNVCSKTLKGYIWLTGDYSFYMIGGGGDYTLKPGETRTIVVSFRPTKEIDYSAEIKVDTNEHRSQQGADLEIIDIIPFKLNDDTHGYDTKVIIKNVGDGYAYIPPENKMVKVVGIDTLSLNQGTFYRQLEVGDDNILDPGEVTEERFCYVFSWRPRSKFTAIVDPFDFVDESNEENNEMQIQLPP